MNFGEWILWANEPVSINCIGWKGSEFAEFGGVVPRDEEVFLSHTKPAELGRRNSIYGGFVVVHFAFRPQRADARVESLLPEYAAICDRLGLPTV